MKEKKQKMKMIFIDREKWSKVKSFMTGESISYKTEYGILYWRTRDTCILTAGIVVGILFLALVQ